MKARNILEVGVASPNEAFPSELAMEVEAGHIVFPTAGLLWTTLWGGRLQLIEVMAGKGPMSLRAAARLVGKDVKTVHGDAHALLRSGILKKNDKGQIAFPYDAIHVKFTAGMVGRHISRPPMIKVYTDTNVLRYFGEAFATRTLPSEIGVQLLLAPLAMLELLSQLGTNDSELALAAVHALPRVHNAPATGVLPWTDDFLRMCLFNLPPDDDIVVRSINAAINRVLNSQDTSELKVEGQQMRTLLDRGKNEPAENFTALLDSMKAEGRVEPVMDQRIFAESIARRAGVDPSTVDIDFVLAHLDAHYRFEQQRIQAALENASYNVRKRANDVYDSELLIYLSDTSLHFLTCDTGFKRAQASSQGGRIHIVPADRLRDPDAAMLTLQNLASEVRTTSGPAAR